MYNFSFGELSAKALVKKRGINIVIKIILRMIENKLTMFEILFGVAKQK